MPRFRKKPVEITAVQWTGENAQEIKTFVGVRDNGESRFLTPDEITGVWEHAHVYDELHDTWVTVYPGQWVIKGVKGEFYPCAEDVFAETYEPVSRVVVNVQTTETPDQRFLRAMGEGWARGNGLV
ncbi:hypothetical protein ACWEJ6_21075 [Nonomuraea sp. NPDC004702]